MKTIYELIDGVHPTLFFKTEEEYIKFCEEFYDSVKDNLEKWRIAHLKSDHESRNRIVD